MADATVERDHDGSCCRRDAALGQVELQVSDGRDRPVTHYCPNLAFDAAVTAAIEGKLARLMQDLESRANNSSLYDEATMFRVGCNMEKYVER